MLAKLRPYYRTCYLILAFLRSELLLSNPSTQPPGRLSESNAHPIIHKNVVKQDKLNRWKYVCQVLMTDNPEIKTLNYFANSSKSNFGYSNAIYNPICSNGAKCSNNFNKDRKWIDINSLNVVISNGSMVY